MGLFSFLFGGVPGSTVQALDDRIWITEDAKFKGLARQLNESNDSAVILLIAHFEDTYEQLTTITDGYSGDVPVQAVLAGNLSSDIAARLSIDESATINLIVAERHPLLSADDAIMQFAEEIPCNCRLWYHLSLEDPLLKMFASEFVQRILDSLGMTEDEPIESNMISRRVKAAQQKLESTATGNDKASSAAEWLELNTPAT
ncbi:MAG: hypothetical protein WBH50_15460 [Fuerstiella sp.]